MTRSRRSARVWLVAATLTLVALGVGAAAWHWRSTEMDEESRWLASELTQPGRPFFQLMHPPASSLEAIERVKRGEPAGEGVLVYPVEDGLYHVSLLMLSEPFWMNDTAVCLGFPSELGHWDVLRCHWEVGQWRLEYADHPSFLSLRVRGPDVGERSLQNVRRVLEAVLKTNVEGPANGIAFMPIGDDGKVLFGLHDRSVREGKLPSWRDDLTWYHDGEAVGLISMREGHGAFYWGNRGGPDYSASWLRPYFDHVFTHSEQELMFPAADAREALDAVEAGRETPGLERIAGSDPLVTNFELLAPAFRIPAEAAECLALRPDRDHPSIVHVRCRHEADGWRLEQAQASERAVWVRGVTEPRDEQRRAERVAAELFGRPIDLEVRGHHQGRTFGRKVPSESKAVRRTVEWWRKNNVVGIQEAVPEDEALRTLRWWTAGDLVGFVHGMVPGPR